MIKTKTKPSEKPTSRPIVIRYAYGNESLKTWFITNTSKQVLPKGSRILFVIRGHYTTSEISTSDTYPIVGNVISDTNGKRIKIATIKWY